MATVLLVRHGETTWNRDGLIQGWAPSQLTARGHEQARTLAAYLVTAYDVDRVVSSDLLRAQETTASLVAALPSSVPTPRFDAAWRERDFGFLQGLTDETVRRRFPEYALDVVGYTAATERPKGGESFLDLRERVLAAWRALLDGAAAHETVLVVTHGGPIRFVLADLKGLDVVDAILGQKQDNCALNEIRIAETPELVRENETR
ncbi:probable phosphoglycerate mutase [Halogranum rubrum]|uniref:Probable phosphoglycerate mutase n=1 Tax=Halogranum rubrum TaxID=553466 RepID=A0A1I4GCC3_9EURY|nr:histidine phosphatase family protein [Halogranum rubrum]SFL27708.1 probable phosphoglycerate mutase [Halogranum rubrum]